MSVWKYQKRYWPKNPLDFPPEEMVPDDVLVVLTGIIRHGEFNYYVLPRHLLYLDAQKAAEVGEDAPFYAGMEGRYGIMTVDEAHEDEFFRAIEPHKRSCERLLEEVYMCMSTFERGHYFTEVLIDFDRKHLVSYFNEAYFFFEKYVPDGWTSERGGIGCGEEYFFMDDGPDGKPLKNIGIGGLEQDYIPLDKRFWIDENGKSIFELLYQEDVKNGLE